jgi:hypothetical protein
VLLDSRRVAGSQKRPPWWVAINAGHTLLAALSGTQGSGGARNPGTNRRLNNVRKSVRSEAGHVNLYGRCANICRLCEENIFVLDGISSN